MGRALRDSSIGPRGAEVLKGLVLVPSGNGCEDALSLSVAYLVEHTHYS